MMDDLKHPLQSNTVPIWAVPLLFSVLVAAIITDEIKGAVGRPRPDFFWRCFPDGIDVYDRWGNVVCHGDKGVIREGHECFPHFMVLCWSQLFVALFVWENKRAFDRGGHVAKLCIVLLPLLVACVVGISRVNDYFC